MTKPKDISCVQEDESSTCTFQFVDVSKFKINILLFILTITKINFLRLIDTSKTPAINSSKKILMYLEHCFSWTWQFLSKPVGFYNLVSCILLINIIFNYDFHAWNMPILEIFQSHRKIYWKAHSLEWCHRN